jgi:hypothetical protein
MKNSVLGYFLFNVIVNDLCNSINRCKLLIFVDDLNISLVTKSPVWHSVSDWWSDNYRRLDIAKTRVVPYSRKTNVLSYVYRLGHATITRSSSLRTWFKVTFSQSCWLLISCMHKVFFDPIRSITLRFTSPERLYVLHFTLVGSKLAYAR